MQCDDVASRDVGIENLHAEFVLLTVLCAGAGGGGACKAGAARASAGGRAQEEELCGVLEYDLPQGPLPTGALRNARPPLPHPRDPAPLSRSHQVRMSPCLFDHVFPFLAHLHCTEPPAAHVLQ